MQAHVCSQSRGTEVLGCEHARTLTSQRVLLSVELQRLPVAKRQADVCGYAYAGDGGGLVASMQATVGGISSSTLRVSGVAGTGNRAGPGGETSV